MGVRERFVADVLKSAGDMMLSRQGAEIAKKTRSRSGTLLSSRSVAVSSGEYMDGKMTFTHPIYERFLDMRRRASSGKRHKRRRIHNRFTYGAYASIASRLMYGLTEDVIAVYRALEDK